MLELTQQDGEMMFLYRYMEKLKDQGNYKQ